jgi:hypothetical protein
MVASGGVTAAHGDRSEHGRDGRVRDCVHAVVFAYEAGVLRPGESSAD